MKKVFFVLVVLVAMLSMQIASAQEFNLIGEVFQQNVRRVNNLLPSTIDSADGQFEVQIDADQDHAFDPETFNSQGQVDAQGFDTKGNSFGIRLTWNTDAGDLAILQNNANRIVFETEGTQALVKGTNNPGFFEDFRIRVNFNKHTHIIQVVGLKVRFRDLQALN